MTTKPVVPTKTAPKPVSKKKGVLPAGLAAYMAHKKMGKH
jgi:hypothetical protein